ncbi:MAG: SAM-dependent methyltransferase [Prevotella sp.]|jgi:type I restriction-modification system DNA methylase subunit|nr:SAM-dependent methyltransferase [Prevotella sp.]
MANERLTEGIVRDFFKNDPLFSSIKWEEQKSTNIRIAECLTAASKSGKGSGRPEFIITFPLQNMDYLIIIECKADSNQHESKNKDKPKDYAVDGVLHYAKCLSSEFTIIAIAVSGETNEKLLVSNFLQNKNESKPVKLADNKLLSIFDYVKTFKNEQFNYNLKDINIVEKAVKLNDDFHSCSISESMRNTIVSAVLLALQDDMFKAAYPHSSSSNDLAYVLIQGIERVLRKAKVRKIDDMIGVYNKILDEPLVKEKTIKRKKKNASSVEFFKEIIRYLHNQVYPLTLYEESGYDILGRFYTEFVRYAASKQKQGLVLTPSHVTELFCDLAKLKVTDIVFDPCCGTGGFLIAAMKKMFSLAGNDQKIKENIKAKQLFGIEIRPEMFTFACSNMMLRGDGKSNIDRGDCFDNKTMNRIKENKPTIAFLNPPYDQGTDVQLEFVEKALDAIAPQNGMAIAIVQMSCAIKNDSATKAVRKRLLEHHTLKAVISMPDDLFYPIGVVTCIMVFESGKPNEDKTWFGYLKDDGFIKRKNKGRVDHFLKWEGIKRRLLDAYKNNDEVVGLSVKHKVSYNDEWCVEAYMETDYSTILQNDFETVMKKYAIFKTIGFIEADSKGLDDEEA